MTVLNSLPFSLPKREWNTDVILDFCQRGLGSPWHTVEKDVKAWLDEDVGAGDVTLLSGLFVATPTMFVVAKQDFKLAGLPLMTLIFHCAHAGKVRLFSDFSDGDCVRKGDIVLAGQAAASNAFLMAERTALNVTARLSGIATYTARVIESLKNASTRPPHLLETRKTTPGLRRYEKYATRVGGARNHRHGLDGGAMLKENHLRTSGLSLRETLVTLKNTLPFLSKLEVEVTSLKEFSEALSTQPDVIMLDNFSVDDVRKAVELRNAQHPHCLLEMSGNLDRADPKTLATLGVDAISMGALIHQATWVDMSMQLFGTPK